MAGSSFGWPSRTLLLQGHLFDQGLINQALEIIEKRGGDFEILNFSVAPNDQVSSRPSECPKRPPIPRPRPRGRAPPARLAQRLHLCA